MRRRTYRRTPWSLELAISATLVALVAMLGPVAQPFPSRWDAPNAVPRSSPEWSRRLPLSFPAISTATPMPSTTTTTAPATTATTAPTAPAATSGSLGECDGTLWNPADGTGVTCAEYLAWSKVAVCEEGGWVGASGPAYPDSLGISAANWTAYGGTSDVSPDAQIVVAERIQANPPDQSGCAPW